MNVASEFFDLSHAGNRDRKKYKTSISFKDNEFITRFMLPVYLEDKVDKIGKIAPKIITYMGYTLYGHVEDIYSIIFSETDFRPWTDLKSNKRIDRILHAAFIEFFSEDTYGGEEKLSYVERLDIMNNFIVSFQNDKFSC